MLPRASTTMSINLKEKLNYDTNVWRVRSEWIQQSNTRSKTSTSEASTWSPTKASASKHRDMIRNAKKEKQNKNLICEKRIKAEIKRKT